MDKKTIDLLVEADITLAQNQWTSGWGVESLADRLADALETKGQELDALRTVVQPVIDAWMDPGIRPDWHEAMQIRLYREWPVLFHAASDLIRNIETKEAG